ncbi:armadillo-type protein [Tribonema minus]|uniref:Armadillo-type protein n=1 Tax=Tribonema minus TaxID=303371 RepID=A0A835YRH9_9STRA|nr:armadillo-type protein [Tribonema minus]
MAVEEEEQRKDEERRALRARNTPGAVAASRASHNANKSKLKSDLKKTSTFTSKVRTLTEAQRATITKDIETLNLSHYVSEIVDAVAEAKLKTSDVSVAVHLCCMMHQRYAGFTEDLIPKLLAPFREDPAEDDKDALRKRRSNLRLLTELHLCGVFDGSQWLLNVLRRLAGERRGGGGGGVQPQQQQQHRSAHATVEAAPADLRPNDVSLVVAFAKHAGQELAGIVPRRSGRLAVFQRSSQERLRVVSAEGQALFLGVLQGVLRRLRGHLVTAHKALQKLERRMEKDRLLCGSLTEEKERNLELSAGAYNKLLSNVVALSDALDEDMPDLPEDKEEEELGGVELWSSGVGLGEGDLGPWDDLETKSFYEDLADLLTAVPPSQLGLTEEQWQELRAQQDARESRQRSGDGGDGGDDAAAGAEEDADLAAELQKLSVQESGGGGSSDALLMMLREELPACFNRERTDAFAIKFCHHNSKSARRKLVRALFEAPRQSLDLLPQYARLVATLDQVLRDIAPALTDDLQGEFRWLLRKRTVTRLIDAKRRNVCFIGELIKFKVAPPIVAFQCLKACFQEFTGSNVEMACMLLESCGRFLYRSKATHARTASYLEILQRFRLAKHLDTRYETMIDNAYYMCKPPEGAGGALRVKQRTPLQLWIRHLLCEQLAEENVEATLRSLRRLPWSGVVQKAFLRTAHRRFTAAHLAADVLAGLHRSHPVLTLRIIDAVLEELRRACESVGGGARDLQRRLGLARFLGELYNYSIVSSAFIFEVLHRLIDYGHAIPPAMKLPRLNPAGGEPLPPVVAPWATHDPRAQHPCDPPGDCLRIRLVVQLLEACAEYFVVGQSRPRLDKFLMHFQRYLFCKQGLPPDTEFAVLDLLDELEGQARAVAEKQAAKSAAAAAAALKAVPDVPSTPLLPRFDSWEEAQAAVEEMEAKEHEAAAAKQGGGGAGEGEGVEGEEEEGEKGDRGGDDYDDDAAASVDDEDGSEEGGERGRRGGSSSSGSDDDDDDGDGDGDDQQQPEEEEEEEEVLVYDKHEYEKSEADYEFELMLGKMQQENLDKSKVSARTSVKADNMDTPSVLSRLSVAEPHASLSAAAAGDSVVAFKLLKRGAKGKSEGVAVHIPADTNLAVQALRASTRESDEREIIKARVLQYEQDQRTLEGSFSPLPSMHNAPISAEAARRASSRTGTRPRGRGGRLFSLAGRGPGGHYGGGGGNSSQVHVSGRIPRL